MIVEGQRSQRHCVFGTAEEGAELQAMRLSAAVLPRWRWFDIF
jgi:hypothetical protein